MRIEDDFDEDVDHARTDPSQKIIFIKAPLPPGPFQIHPEEIQKQHVHYQMPDRGMQEKVGRELPNKQPPRDVPGDQSEKVLELRSVFGRENQLDDCLYKKNARACNDDIANGGRQHPSPTDARAERARIT